MAEPGQSGDDPGSDEGADPPSPAGDAGGTPEGFVPKADLDRIEAERRQTQSERDRARERITELEARIARGEAPGKDPPSDGGDSGLTPEAVARIAAEAVDATMNRRDMMAAARVRLSHEYPSASEDVLSGSYKTPEELASAAQRSHESAEAHARKVREDVEATIRKEYKDTYGIDPPAPSVPSAGGSNGSRQLTAADLGRMPMDDLMKLSREEREAALTRK